MVVRRFALAVGLLVAVLCSQVPEFAQQYRQRLGGALDELRREIAAFDAEAGAQSLTRDEALVRLRANADPLAVARGDDIGRDVERERRLGAQARAFETAGPVDLYWVFAERLDPALAANTWAIFQPAVPATGQGLAAAGAGFILGYGAARIAATPFRRRRRPGVTTA